MALPFAVLALTSAVSALGAVLAAETVAMTVFLLVGGAVADRFSRRSLIVGADVVRFISQWQAKVDEASATLYSERRS